jgi:hypothetical protein
LPGKIFAFLLSAIIASLPITGFLICLGRKIKAKKEKMDNATPSEHEGKLANA